MMKMRMMTMLGVLAVFSVSGAYANDPGGACRDDIKRLCGDTKPGSGEVRDCMSTHESELSQGCKDKVAEHRKHFEEKKKEIETACQADIKQYCANVTPGEGREIACLKSYEDKVSAGCKEKLPRHMMKGKGMGKGMHRDSKKMGPPSETPHP